MPTSPACAVRRCACCCGPTRPAGERGVGEAGEQRLEHEADLEAGEVGAQAEVVPWPKARWGFGLAARRRSGTGRRTRPRRGWRTPTTGVTLSPARIGGRRARSRRSRCGRLYGVVEAHRRISSTADGSSERSRRARATGRGARQGEHARGDRVAGGLAAGGDQQVEEHLQLEVGELRVDAVDDPACSMSAAPRPPSSPPARRRPAPEPRTWAISRVP